MLQQVRPDRQTHQVRPDRQTHNDDPYSFAQPAAWGGDLISFGIGLLIRQYLVILAIALPIAAAGIGYLIVTPRSYEVSAIVAIEGRSGPFQKAGEQYQNQASGSDALVEKLSSDQVAEKVVTALGLDRHPEFLDPPRGLRGLFNDLRNGFRKGGDTKPDPLRQAVIEFRNGLNIKRPTLTTFEIGFRSRDPEFGATIVDAVADAYNEVQREDASVQARNSANWFQQRLTELKKQLTEADRAVVEYKTKNNIVETDGKLIGDQQLTELNRQLIAARAQREEAAARLSAVQDTIVSGNVPDGARSDVLQGLRQQLVALTGKERDYATRFGSSHSAVLNLRNDISEVRRAMMEELKNIAKTLATDVEIAKSREAAVRANMLQAVGQSQSTSSAQNALRELETAAATYRGLYDTFHLRQSESIQQESFPRTVARLISSATPTTGTSSPNIAIILALSVFGGLGSGIGIAMIRELLDRVIRTPDQIESLWGVECLAVLPMFKKIDSQKTLSEHPPRPRNWSGSGPQESTDNHNLLQQVIEEPFSRYTEGIRSIKLAVDLGENKIVGVTSTLPNEGKSTIAANLALLASQVGKRVILIDCDLRNPSLTRALSRSARHGLLEVLNGSRTLDKTVHMRSSKLEFLPAIMRVRMPHTAEVLGSRAMIEFLQHLRTKYDYIILDLPPLAPVIDARAALNLVDGYCFVVEWGETKIKVINHALNYARSANERLLGVVLNKVDMSVLKRFEKYTGKYYTEDKYYTRYGFNKDEDS